MLENVKIVTTRPGLPYQWKEDELLFTYNFMPYENIQINWL